MGTYKNGIQRLGLYKNDRAYNAYYGGVQCFPPKKNVLLLERENGVDFYIHQINKDGTKYRTYLSRFEQERYWNIPAITTACIINDDVATIIVSPNLRRCVGTLVVTYNLSNQAVKTISDTITDGKFWNEGVIGTDGHLFLLDDKGHFTHEYEWSSPTKEWKEVRFWTSWINTNPMAIIPLKEAGYIIYIDWDPTHVEKWCDYNNPTEIIKQGVIHGGGGQSAAFSQAMMMTNPALQIMSGHRINYYVLNYLYIDNSNLKLGYEVAYDTYSGAIDMFYCLRFRGSSAGCTDLDGKSFFVDNDNPPAYGNLMYDKLKYTLFWNNLDWVRTEDGGIVKTSEGINIILPTSTGKICGKWLFEL